MPDRLAAFEAVEEYLEAIHRFSSSAEGVSTTRLAEHLQVTPASVTGMLRRLREAGLITYHRYGDIALTALGERRAHNLIRRHRLAERLLTDVLKVPLEQAHQEACRLEHAFSPQVATRLAQALGDPLACPHGHPIDAAREDHTIALTEAPLRRALVVVRLEDESPDMVHYLVMHHLLPGTRCKVLSRDPVGGLIHLEVEGTPIPLSMSVAQYLRVQRHLEA